jgi:hypothetical protein
MATYTIHERRRHERTGRPYTFGGTLEVVHTHNSGTRLEHVAVYRRDDGQRVLEFRMRGLLRGDLGADTYEIASPEDLRRVIIEGCAGPQARAVGRQLGLEIGESGRG